MACGVPASSLSNHAISCFFDSGLLTHLKSISHTQFQYHRQDKLTHKHTPSSLQNAHTFCAVLLTQTLTGLYQHRYVFAIYVNPETHPLHALKVSCAFIQDQTYL